MRLSCRVIPDTTLDWLRVRFNSLSYLGSHDKLKHIEH
jgi:hypothetical protein